METWHCTLKIEFLLCNLRTKGLSSFFVCELWTFHFIFSTSCRNNWNFRGHYSLTVSWFCSQERLTVVSGNWSNEKFNKETWYSNSEWRSPGGGEEPTVLGTVTAWYSKLHAWICIMGNPPCRFCSVTMTSRVEVGREKWACPCWSDGVYYSGPRSSCGSCPFCAVFVHSA